MVKCNTNLKMCKSLEHLYDATIYTKACRGFERSNGYPSHYVFVLNGDYYHFEFSYTDEGEIYISEAKVFSYFNIELGWQTITQEDFK